MKTQSLVDFVLGHFCFTAIDQLTPEWLKGWPGWPVATWGNWIWIVTLVTDRIRENEFERGFDGNSKSAKIITEESLSQNHWKFTKGNSNNGSGYLFWFPPGKAIWTQPDQTIWHCIAVSRLESGLIQRQSGSTSFSEKGVKQASFEKYFVWTGYNCFLRNSLLTSLFTLKLLWEQFDHFQNGWGW